MTRFEAVVGPVDRLRGMPLPDHLNLNAIILERPPGPDGAHFDQADVISKGIVRIEFKIENHRLLSVAEVTIPLRSGNWPSAFMVLFDQDDPFAVGAVLTSGGAVISGCLEASKNRISIAHIRRG